MVAGIHFSEKQVIGADIQCGTDPDDIFRAQCFFAKFCGRNGLGGDTSRLEQRGWKYLIRLKDRNRTYAYGITLPDQLEFDLPVRVTLGRLTVRQLERRGIPVPEAYCRLPNQVPFDDLEPGSAGFYLFSARIVRLLLHDGSTETLITNLDPDQFPPDVLRSLYARRWGIETSFRQLKYTVGMVHLHSKRPELILQEIMSAFIIFKEPLIKSPCRKKM